jgi:hypothetical protein
MDLKDKIKVMQHFAEGGKVEFKYTECSLWEFAYSPIWDWCTYDYRIAQPKTKQPLTAADFPPGTVIRWKTQDKRSWTSIVAVTPHEIRLGNGNTISYSASLSIHSILDENNLEYSTDQGKTWLPCYKEV